VLAALRELGHEVEHLAIFDDFDLIRQKLARFPADIVFNLADQFRNNRAFDQNIVSLLELQGVPFTGCGSTGLTLCKHKGISKKILGYHRIRVPEFAVFPRGRRIARPPRLKFPILVKPLKEEASLGIARASFVENDDEFRERVQFIHERFDNDVITEEYIAGRELYAPILGNHRLQMLPLRELVFAEVPEDEPKIATFKAKWDDVQRQSVFDTDDNQTSTLRGLLEEGA
jgi:D-alanine-D-alanine ligase